MKRVVLVLSAAFVLAAIGGAYVLGSLWAPAHEVEGSAASVELSTGAPASEAIAIDASSETDPGGTVDVSTTGGSGHSKGFDAGSDLYDMGNADMCPYGKEL